MLQRVLTSTILLYFAAIHVVQAGRAAPSVLHVIAAIAGTLLLLGLWTPLAGITIAIVEVLLASSGNPLMAMMLAMLGISVAMIGPGMWSIDAHLYGRKHLEDPRQ